MSCIAKIWDLDPYSEPFIIPKDEERFQSKLLETLKIYILSLISLNLVTRWSTKNFLVAFIWFRLLFDST